MSNSVFLLLGTNLGDRMHYLESATALIREQVGEITAESPIYETESWGYCDNDYLNQVICCATTLKPEDVLERTSQIENTLGRIRNKEGYQARTIDIDILFHENQVVDTPDLTIPHPRIQERRFVLIPMCDISPEMVHPTLKKTMKELLQCCTDSCNVKLYLKK